MRRTGERRATKYVTIRPGFNQRKEVATRVDLPTGLERAMYPMLDGVRQYVPGGQVPSTGKG